MLNSLSGSVETFATSEKAFKVGVFSSYRRKTIHSILMV